MLKKFKVLPYFKFDVNAWLVSTRGMEPAVKGIYIDMLALCWNNQIVCGITSNHDKLSALLGVTLKTFDKLFAEISDKFVKTTFEGVEYYVNMRLLRNREEIVDLQDVRAEAAGRKSKLKAPSADAMTELLTSNCSVLHGHTDTKKSKEDEEQTTEETGSAGSSTTSDLSTKSPKLLHKIFRAAWQAKKGPAAQCRLPQGKLASWWQEVCESHPAELIEKAFALWIEQEGSRYTTDSPIYDFLRAPYGTWLEKVDPTRKFSGTQFTEKDKELAIAEARARLAKQLGHDKPRDKQADMSVEELLS